MNNDMILFYRKALLLIIITILSAVYSLAQDTLATAELKKQSLEELMEMEVTSVSKKSEKAFGVPASIHVITQEDIRRSGVTSIPEALRLAPNLDVDQIDSRQWAISARGFNTTTTNKLLVLIDGRSVYTQLYSGVFWDVQNIFLEDIDRIEVISGPGATLWGTNAVNGVINIITKGAEKASSSGLLLRASSGTQELFSGGVRYGGELSQDIFYRAYIMNQNKNESQTAMQTGAGDLWRLTQGGFRMDFEGIKNSKMTVQQDIYAGTFGQPGNGDLQVSGENSLGKYQHNFENLNSMTLQFYLDHTNRIVPQTFRENLNTYDLDFQYQLPLGEIHNLIGGAGFRYMIDQVATASVLAFPPDFLVMRLYTAFLQDEISIMDNRGKLVIGSKFEHNDFSGFEFQPSIKFHWSIDERNSAWAAITRAVRTPSRIDRDLFAPATPPYTIAGGPGFLSEKVIAYELGYRTKLSSMFTSDITLFYNSYNDLRSVEPPIPYTLQNGLEGKTYGFELEANYQFKDWWRWNFGYAYLHKDIQLKSWSHDLNNGTGEGNDSPHRVKILSRLDLPYGFEVDTWFRIVGELPNPPNIVPSYVEMDVSVGYTVNEYLSVNVTGQNLLHDRHPEFGTSATRRQIPRSVYAKILMNF